MFKTQDRYMAFVVTAALLIYLLLLTSCKGNEGPQGPQGLVTPIVGPKVPILPPGDVITVVQFCPGTPSYTNLVFPEVGFLIKGSVYAVFSQNDGFLTLLPPGAYLSNAVGSTCDFTINADGTITN